MNIIAILNHLGVFFKEEPIRQLQASLERKGFEVFIRSMWPTC